MLYLDAYKSSTEADTFFLFTFPFISQKFVCMIMGRTARDLRHR